VQRRGVDSGKILRRAQGCLPEARKRGATAVAARRRGAEVVVTQSRRQRSKHGERDLSEGMSSGAK
jgi:hypothetical protein